MKAHGLLAVTTRILDRLHGQGRATPRTTRPGTVPVSARSPYDVQPLQRELPVRRLTPSWPS
ncbi:hypothetical protein ABT120_09820 [Nonomuraea angiospora]|uniref:hypothetical protein n=1 Tax=Nonomuraea angiospora TaxID=46172 RepID=UPI00332B53BE